MSDFFTTTKRGEIPELRADLHSSKEDKKKETVKKVLTLLTSGKDVSILYPDVLKCINTTNLELKKLVYLYILHYAKNNIENAVAAIGPLQTDCTDSNPLIRALAIRTMGSLRVEKVMSLLCASLKICLKDSDPYVSKTATICIAKLYDINPSLVKTNGFLDTLRDQIGDGNPMVVSNAVAALSEIDDISTEEIFRINKSNISNLLNALEICTEWGQVYILNSLAKYTPQDSKEAQSICERITSRLQHVNSAVVMAAVKVIIKFIDIIENSDDTRRILEKLKPPLVTMISREPEIQYVTLRNINLILQKYPIILYNEIRVFFCKYNDPLYVKMEKLEILIMLANEKNVDQLLLEFKDYALKVDEDFVRKAVRSIGRAAIKLEKAAEKCIHVLLDLVKNTQVNYVVQEAIIVIKDIFRRYPDQYLSIISTLCEYLDELSEPESKAAFIWIIGEYADRIDTAETLLEGFLKNLKGEDSQVQLQLITSVVKLFLKKPKSAQKMVQDALNIATTQIDNPDIRDRGFVYWRLLYEHPAAARQIVLSQKPVIRDDIQRLDNSVLDELLGNLSTLACVYHKPPSTFVERFKVKIQAPDYDKDIVSFNRSSSHTLSQGPPKLPPNLPPKHPVKSVATEAPPLPAQPPKVPPQLPPKAYVQNTDDITESSSPEVSQNNDYHQQMPTILHPSADGANGLQVDGHFVNNNDQLIFEALFTNTANEPAGPFQIKFNKNPFNVTVPVQISDVIEPGQKISVSLPCTVSPPTEEHQTTIIQIALRSSLGVAFFAADLPIPLLFSNDGKLVREEYLENWKKIEKEYYQDIVLVTDQMEEVKEILEKNKIFFVAHRKVSDQDFLYMTAKTLDLSVFLLEFAISEQTCRLCVKTLSEAAVPLISLSIHQLLSGQ